jgi:hypothetical protein
LRKLKHNKNTLEWNWMNSWIIFTCIVIGFRNFIWINKSYNVLKVMQRKLTHKGIHGNQTACSSTRNNTVIFGISCWVIPICVLLRVGERKEYTLFFLPLLTIQTITWRWKKILPSPHTIVIHGINHDFLIIVMNNAYMNFEK